jgi:hypothetical protein
MEVQDKDGKTYNAVFMGGMSASGVDRGPLLNNELYPEIKDDFERSFAHLKSLQCDVFLYGRASSIELDNKLAKLDSASQNPFIDQEGCAWYIEYYEKRFQKQLADEMAAR